MKLELFNCTRVFLAAQSFNPPYDLFRKFVGLFAGNGSRFSSVRDSAWDQRMLRIFVSMQVGNGDIIKTIGVGWVGGGGKETRYSTVGDCMWMW